MRNGQVMGEGAGGGGIIGGRGREDESPLVEGGRRGERAQGILTQEEGRDEGGERRDDTGVGRRGERREIAKVSFEGPIGPGRKRGSEGVREARRRREGEGDARLGY